MVLHEFRVQACICATYKSAAWQPTKTATLVNSLFEVLVAWMRACEPWTLASKHCSFVCSQTEDLFGPHTQARISNACCLQHNSVLYLSMVEVHVYSAGRGTIRCRGCSWSPAWASHWSYPVWRRWPPPPYPLPLPAPHLWYMVNCLRHLFPFLKTQHCCNF